MSFYIDPRYIESEILSQHDKNVALQFASEINEELVSVIAKFHVSSGPFNSVYMSSSTRNSMSPSDWWMLFDVSDEIKQQIRAILNCSPSTANLERVFSSFKWVQSKERNRLGIEKAAKLVFILKTLNMDVNSELYDDDQ